MKKENFKKRTFGLCALSMLLSLGIIKAAYCQGQDEQAKVTELSIEEVTSLALENSLDIQIAKFDAYMNRTSLAKAESIFDTFLNASLSFDLDKRAQASSIFGTEQKEHKFSVGLEKKLPSGTTVSVDAVGTKSRSDSPFATLNPYNEASAEFSITQSLGKNFFGIADRSSIRITKLDIENSDFSSLDDIENAIYQVQKAYWNLALEDTQLAIARDMLKRAEELYKIYQDKFGLGLVEEPELLSMEALVSTRFSDVVIKELQREAAKNNLLFLINKGDFEDEIMPKDSLTCDASGVTLYEQLIGAIDSRRDYRRAKNEVEKNKIELVVKKNALWPEIDFEATLTRNNLYPDRQIAWEGLGKNANDDIFLGLKVKLPLENREAKADLKKTNLEKQKLLLALKKTERVILRELNDKVNDVNAMENEVNLFANTVKIHEKKLDKEIERLNYGRSDADTLIRFEEDLLQARLALASYFYQYRTSLLELELAKNSLLDKYWKEPL